MSTSEPPLDSQSSGAVSPQPAAPQPASSQPAAQPVSARPVASQSVGVLPRRQGVSKLWVVAAGLIGLVVGVAATFGVTLVMAQTESAKPATIDPVELNSNQWFAEGDTLPKGVAEPGSEFALGSSAKVLVGAANGTQSVAAITVNSVEAIGEKDAELLKSVQPALAGQTLFEISYTVEYVSGDPLAGVQLGDAIYPVDAEGAQLLRVPVSGWKKCGASALPATIDASADGQTKAAPATMCAVAASPEGGAAVTGALFAQAGGPYSLAAKGQLTWLAAN